MPAESWGEPPGDAVRARWSVPSAPWISAVFGRWRLAAGPQQPVIVPGSTRHSDAARPGAALHRTPRHSRPVSRRPSS